MPGPRPLRPGDPGRLGAYRIVGLLGEGGQGTVYLGQGPDGVRVAVKVLHARLAGDEGALRRFLREVETAGRVAPFCTARVLDAAMSATGPYVVSEYVPGESLRDLVAREGPRDPGALERLAVGTATALAAIHEAGIVHRDFKPANVMIGPDGPRVIDFGIARALDAASTEASAQVGTPAYMSPEQIAGGPVGPASDMFSWGATLAYAATGTSVFGRDSVPAIMHRVLTFQPDLSRLSEPLRGLVAAALSKDPALRPSPSDVLPALLRSPGAPALPVPPPPLGLDDTSGPAGGTTAVDRRPKRRAVLAGGAVLLGAATAPVLWSLLRDGGAGGTSAQLQTTLTGHAGIVFSVVFSPADGNVLASAGEDKTVLLWDLATRQSRTPLVGHRGSVTDVAISPDGRTLASSAEDKTVRLWDMATGRPSSSITPVPSTTRSSARTESSWPPPATTEGSGCGIRPAACSSTAGKATRDRPTTPRSTRWTHSASSVRATTRRCACGTPPPAVTPPSYPGTPPPSPP